MVSLVSINPPRKVPGRGPVKYPGTPYVNFSWASDPYGRVAKIVALNIAETLVSRAELVSGSLPSRKNIWGPFVTLLPWFPDYYDLRRELDALRRGREVRAPLGPEDVWGRVNYMFRTKRPGEPAVREQSTEHPETGWGNKRKPQSRLLLEHVHYEHGNEIRWHLRNARAIPQPLALKWGMGE